MVGVSLRRKFGSAGATTIDNAERIGTRPVMNEARPAVQLAWPYELVIVAFFGDPIDVGGWMAERLAAIGIGPKSFQPVSSVISMTMFGRCACASRSAAT